MSKIILSLVFGYSASVFANAVSCAYQVKQVAPKISNAQIIELCQGAKDTSVASCLYNAMTTPDLMFDLNTAVALCKPLRACTEN